MPYLLDTGVFNKGHFLVCYNRIKLKISILEITSATSKAIIKADPNLFPFIPQDTFSALNIKIILQMVTGIESKIRIINDIE